MIETIETIECDIIRPRGGIGVISCLCHASMNFTLIPMEDIFLKLYSFQNLEKCLIQILSLGCDDKGVIDVVYFFLKLSMVRLKIFYCH